MTYRAPLGRGQRRYRRTRLHASMPHDLAERIIAIAQRSGSSLTVTINKLLILGLAIDQASCPPNTPRGNERDKGLDRPLACGESPQRRSRAREHESAGSTACRVGMGREN